MTIPICLNSAHSPTTSLHYFPNFKLTIKMLSLSIPKLEDDDPDLIMERKIYAILKEYLQPDSTTAPETAAKGIDQFLPAKRPDLGVKIEPVGAFLPNLWDLFMDIARQIASDHESQDRLVKLVDALSQLPSTVEIIWGVCSLSLPFLFFSLFAADRTIKMIH